MVAKSHNEPTARGRAGVPLARAQRLNQKAAAQTGRKSSGVVPMTLIGVSLMGVLVYFSGASQTAPVLVEATSTNVPPASVPPEITPAISKDVAVAIPDQAETVQVASVVAPPEPTITTSARPRLAPCVETIEITLQRLEAVNADNSPWSTKKTHIQDVAQAVLNCSQATVQLDGDVGLAQSDLADLRVRWDRENAILDLTIVDSVAAGTSKVTYTDDGQPVEFLVH